MRILNAVITPRFVLVFYFATIVANFLSRFR